MGRGCRGSQNSTRSKKGKNHRPRAAMGTKTASQSKPTTTAALGAKNPPLQMGISPGEKLKKTTGQRLLAEPKFDPIKNGKKPSPAGCRGYQNCIGIKANHNCSSWSQNAPLHMGISPGEKLKKSTCPRLSSEPKFDPTKKR